ncbi:MAG: T9SS type A sorting domain-containing protein [Bacteroidota bacterium]
MKKSIFLAFLLIFTIALQAQRDTVVYSLPVIQKNAYAEAAGSLNIYPVPVRENHFTIKSDKDISFVKITNIIGQDIFKTQYSNPQNIIRIDLDNPQRGMYLVTVIFDDNVRVVKKIMIEQSE